MALPTLSIVTPCLNAMKWLPAALESVRSQDYPGVEMVVVDGGSTDGTVEYLEGLQWPGLRWVSEPDKGLSDAVNKGVAMATGDVVGWLNADDEYMPGALAAVGRAFEQQPAAEWLTGQCPIVDEAGNPIRQPVTAYKNWLLRHYSLRLLLTQNFISCPASFVRRSAWQAVGDLALEIRYSMDYDLFLRLARRSDPIVLHRPLAHFRMVEGTLSMTGFEKQFEEHHEVARMHGTGHTPFVLANRVASSGIIATYRVLRWRRARALRAQGAT